MTLIIGIIVAIVIAAALIWVVRNPGLETEMGAENKARREARRAQKGETDPRS